MNWYYNCICLFCFTILWNQINVWVWDFSELCRFLIMYCSLLSTLIALILPLILVLFVRKCWINSHHHYWVTIIIFFLYEIFNARMKFHFVINWLSLYLKLWRCVELELELSIFTCSLNTMFIMNVLKNKLNICLCINFLI